MRHMRWGDEFGSVAIATGEVQNVLRLSSAMPEGVAPYVIILTDARCNFGDSPSTLSAS
jgi:hypothetical protein